MAIANTHYGFCSVAAGLKFTYTGNYQTRADGVSELLSTGDITFLEDCVIDVFMVGGGASGFSPNYSQDSATAGYGGGGAGYTRTIRRVSVTAGQSFAVTIGEGGTASPNSHSSNGGKQTAFGSGYTVPGGAAAVGRRGGAGGSGGGGGVASNADYGAGGSDGNDGEIGTGTGVTGGTGQGFTTHEFGEASGKLYAGGAGGGRYMVSGTPIVSPGGSGGGGAGAWVTTKIADGSQAAGAGGANTGGGGGGGAFDQSVTGTLPGGSGGSGIVCFREAAELPELAGAWVLNKRVYPPNQQILETVNFTSVGLTAEIKQARIGDGTTGSGNDYIGLSTTITNPSYNTIYTYKTNTWSNIGSLTSAKWTFPAGTTASDEFRAWLASNAAKQA